MPDPGSRRPDEDGSEVGRLLQEAGPREDLPEEELAALRTAAEGAWRRAVADHAAASAPPAGRRPGIGWSGWAAAVAALVFLALAALVASWWQARPAAPAPRLARVEAVEGPVVVEREGGDAALSPGAHLEIGARLHSPPADVGPDVARPDVARPEADLPEAARPDGGGAWASLRLADGEGGFSGPELRVGPGSRVVLAAPRRVELRAGAVYVDGGDEGGDPVRVVTPLGTVTDVGTRFLVEVGDGAAEPVLRVRVRDGAVEIRSPGRAGHGGREVTLGAGQGAVVDAAGAVATAPVDPFGDGWEWVLRAAGGFRLEGRSLADLLVRTRRETGWEIRFADPAVARRAAHIELHGELGNLPPDRAIFVVLPGTGLEGDLEDGVLTLRPAVPPAATPRTPR